MKTATALALTSVITWGCASAPRINYYTLSMDPSGRVRSESNVVVERFRTTEAIGRSQILISTSPTEIEYYAADQWASGVGELVQQKLAEEFGPHVDGRKTFVVSGTVLSFEQVDRAGGSEARVKLHVAVRDAASKRYQEPVIERTYSVVHAVSGPKPSAVVEALSRGVEDIAAKIADDLG